MLRTVTMLTTIGHAPAQANPANVINTMALCQFCAKTCPISKIPAVVIIPQMAVSYVCFCGRNEQRRRPMATALQKAAMLNVEILSVAPSCFK